MAVNGPIGAIAPRIDIAVADKARVLREAERRGRVAGDNLLLIGGTRFNLIS